MATKKISELEAITEADDSDVLAIVDVSEGKTNKITKNKLLIGAGHSIEMSLNQETYALTLILKNAAGTELSTASIDLPNENSITDISYNNGKLTLTKQSGTTTEVDITGLINGLVTETALTNLANAIKGVIGIQTNTYDNTKTYNTGDIVVQNEKIYKANQDNITGTFDSSKWDEISLYEYQKIQDEAIEENYKVITKLQEDVEDLTERVEDAENNEMTYTPTPATSHYLQDSADSRFRKFIPIGRTTQESTTGANLQKFNTRETATYNYKCDEKGQVTITGNISSYVSLGYNLSSNPMTLTAGTYKLKVIGKISSNTSILLNGTTGITLDSNQEYTYILSNDTSSFYIALSVNTGTHDDNFYITLASGTTATTERYTGGEPAPNPKYPIPIKNTGDNGSVNEKVQNKNLFDKDNYSTIDGYIGFDISKLKIGEQYTFSTNLPITFFKISPNSGGYNSVVKNDNNGFTKFTFTMNKNSHYAQERTQYLFIGLSGYNVIQNINDIANYELQLEQGTTVTSYVPHSEQNISFPLAQGQKLMEGDYLADDGVHHVRGEIILNDQKYWYTNQNQNQNNTFYVYTEIFDNVIDASNEDLCNIAKRSQVWNVFTPNLFFTVNEYGKLRFRVSQDIVKSVDEWKSYIKQQYDNGTPIKINHKLLQEVIDPYTEEQKTAWEQIKKARTYKNVTHISSEDETPANVEVEYVQDTKTYIDNKVTALTNAITSLGGNV